jgi:hypothetical protein
MKKTIQISAILSWINLVTGSIIVLASLLMATVSPCLMTILIPVVLAGSVVLHSYAALQLRKSILYPEMPLAGNTPVGIRFIGYIALLFAIMIIGNAIVILQNPATIVQNIKFPAEPKNLNIEGLLKSVGIFILFFGLSIMVNVVLSWRLLKWYLLANGNERNDVN